MSNRIRRVMSKINYAMAWVGVASLSILLLYNFVNVISRYLFARPLPGVTELSGYMVGIFVFLGLAYARETNVDMTIDILSKKATGVKGFILNCAIGIIMAFTALVLLLGGAKLAIDKIGVRSSTDIAVLLFPFYMVLPIGSLFLFIQSVQELGSLIFSRKERE